jgi:hypothetical protein
MKKFILIMLLIFSFGFSTKESNITTSTYKDWKIENKGEWGSFYWKVDKSQTKYNGYYWYYVYFYSNSYLKTDNDTIYDLAITYIQDVQVKMHEKNKDGYVYNIVPVKLSYILCDFTYDKYNFYFWSQSDNCDFILTFKSADPYNSTGKKITIN